MDEVSSLPSALPFGINFRSMGMKLIVVCALALFMTIPALFVGGLVQERTRSSRGGSAGDKRPCGRPADLPRTDACHSLHHSASDSE